MAKKRGTRKPSSNRPARESRPEPRKRPNTSRKVVLPSSPHRKPPVDNHTPSPARKSSGKKRRVRDTPRPIPTSVLQQPIWKSEEKRDWQKRSLAAKKGWLTRKYNEKLKAIEERYVKREREYQKELRKAAKAVAAKEKTIIYTQEQLQVKGAEIHKEIEKATRDIKNEFTRRLDIMDRLNRAQLAGRFDDEAYDIAEEYDMEPREVYTMWAYNGVVD